MAVKYLILNADTETNGFNKPIKVDGKWVRGSEYHALMEGAFQLLTVDNEIIDSVHEYLLDEKRIDNWNESTRDFHNKSHDEESAPFLETWEAADKISIPELEKRVISMLREHVPDLKEAHPLNEVQIILCARSVGFDYDFINAQMPELAKYLSHQVLDVSVFRVAMRMFHPSLRALVPGETSHNAYEDCEFIRDEIDEIKDLIESIPTEQKIYKDYRLESHQCSWGDLYHAVVGKILSYFC